MKSASVSGSPVSISPRDSIVRSPFDGESSMTCPPSEAVDKRDDGAWAVVAGGHLLEVFRVT